MKILLIIWSIILTISIIINIIVAIKNVILFLKLKKEYNNQSINMKDNVNIKDLVNDKLNELQTKQDLINEKKLKELKDLIILRDSLYNSLLPLNELNLVNVSLKKYHEDNRTESVLITINSHNKCYLRYTPKDYSNLYSTDDIINDGVIYYEAINFSTEDGNFYNSGYTNIKELSEQVAKLIHNYNK